jgi:hypothetical protein
VYSGRIQNALTGGKVIKAAFEPLIDEDLYDRAQLVLSGRGLPHQRRRRVNRGFPYAGSSGAEDAARR